MPFPPLEITDHWGRLNDELVRLVDNVPDERMDWSPQPYLWDMRRILQHIASARDYWMGAVVKDGDAAPNVYQAARSKDDIKRELGRSWERLAGFLADPGNLSKEYRREDRGEEWRQGSRWTGHWIAFHLLEHDIHHRADVLHYLALLGIEHPAVGTP